MNKSLAVLAVLLAATVAYAVDPNPAAPPISVQQMLQNSPKETAPQGATRIITVRGGVVRQLSYSSIHGTPGATGPQGPTGATGAQGIQGPQGNAGASGPNQVTSSTSTTFASGTLLGSNGTTVKAATGAEVRAVLGVSTLSGSNTGDQDLSGLVVTTDPRLSDARTPTAHNHSGANITSGTVPSANGGAGTVNGILKANGAGVVSAATAGTDYLTPTGSAAGLTSFPTLNQSTTGNAATATALQTARTINGVSFNGESNITVADSTKEPALGNPSTNGYVLSSTAAGVRSWVAPGGGGSTSLSVAADYPADIASNTTAATPAYVEEAIANAGTDATYTNIVDLWDTCTAGYLKFDGTCSTPSGSMTWPSTAGIPYWTSGTAWGGAYNATTKIPANYVDTLNQNTTGTAAGLAAAYVDWAAGSGGASILNKPTIPADISGASFITKAAEAGLSNETVLPTCSGTDKLTFNGTTLSCAADQEGAPGGGITSLGTLTAATQTFAKVDDTNVTLSIGSATSTHTFTLGWTGTLADGRITSAGTWNAKQTALVSGTNIKTVGGVSLLGSGDLGILGSAYGGTGNGFTKFTGPTTAEKTFTLPNSSATLLYSGGALGTPSSGTLTNATGLPIAGITGLGTGVGTALGNALGGAAGVTTTIAAGTSALDTSAIASGACATAVATTATGTATTDVINWGFNGDPTGVTGYAPTTNGMLTIIAYPSANNVNYKVCNNTAASITPGAITLNWRVQR